MGSLFRGELLIREGSQLCGGSLFRGGWAGEQLAEVVCCDWRRQCVGGRQQCIGGSLGRTGPSETVVRGRGVSGVPGVECEGVETGKESEER